MNKIKKIGLVLFTVVLFGLGAGTAAAVSPSNFGLHEGDLISATGDNDIFIINEYGYKRLFLNPAIFNMYGHLGGWANVKTVSPATRDAFITSPYYRADGDTKVYKLEQTGEDTGILRWVNVTQEEFLANANVNQIFTINALESNWYSRGADFTFAPVNVNKAVVGNVISSQTITKNASGFTMLNVKFEGNGDVNTLSVKRLGFGDNTDYENDGVYLYKDGVRLTDVKSFNSDRVATFNNLKLKAPFVLSVVADFSDTSKTGHSAKVELSGDYNGLPLQSNTFSFAAAESGLISFSKTGSLDPVNVGEKNVQVSEFKATADANNEDVTLRHLELLNAGNSDLANVKLSDGTTTWTGTVVDDRLVFDTNVVIKTGKTKTFKVYADVLGDENDTVKLYIENPYDVYATGNVYGFGVVISNDSFNEVAESHVLTLNEVDGTITPSAVSGDKVVALWGDTGTTLFQFKLEAEDESFTLDNLAFSVDEDVIKKIYVYSGNTLVGSESVDGATATVSSDFVLTGEKTLTVKADFNDLDASVSESFTPALTKVDATGVDSENEFSWTGTIAGDEVYAYVAYPSIARTDTLSSTETLFNVNDVEVLKFKVSAVGGDIRLASSSYAFTFTPTVIGSSSFNGYINDNDPFTANAGVNTQIVADEDDVVISEGDDTEFTVYANFVNYPVSGQRYFRLELKDIASSLKWQVKNSDGDWVDAGGSTIETIDGLPLKSSQFQND